MDSIVGSEYEHGLGKLKALAESTPVPAAAGETLKITEVDANAIDIAYVEGVTSLDPDAISKALASAYSRIGQFMQSNALTQNGAPIAVNRFYDESGWGFQAAIPVAGVTEAIRTAASGAGVCGSASLMRDAHSRAFTSAVTRPCRMHTARSKTIWSRKDWIRMAPRGSNTSAIP